MGSGDVDSLLERQKPEWDEMVSQGWLFSAPFVIPVGFVGLAMKRDDVETAFFVSRRLSFNEIHSRFLAMAQAVAGVQPVGK